MKMHVLARCLSVVLIALFLIAPLALASQTYTWQFRMPSDAAYDNCTITFYADGYAILSNEKRVDRGNTISWSSTKPLSMIFGYCDGAYFLNGQYCKGQNVKSGM